MRRTIALLLSVVVVVVSGCAQEASPDEIGSVTTASRTSSEGTREIFRDPQRTYTIELGRDWRELPGTLVEEIEAWQVGATEDGFTPNVNVLTQAAPGLDLQEYVDLSGESGEDLGGYEVIDLSIVDGAHGQLGVMDYTSRQGSHDLHHLGVFAVADDRAIVATLTAPEAVFDALREEVWPYLLTLQNIER